MDDDAAGMIGLRRGVSQQLSSDQPLESVLEGPAAEAGPKDHHPQSATELVFLHALLALASMRQLSSEIFGQAARFQQKFRDRGGNCRFAQATGWAAAG
jgi:hypothetical protein